MGGEQSDENCTVNAVEETHVKIGFVVRDVPNRATNIAM